MSNSNGAAAKDCCSGRADLENRKFCGYTDAERKSIETRPAMDVEPTSPASEETLIRPTRARKDGPIEAE